MEWLRRMTDAVDFMETHMEEPFDASSIAKSAYASAFHFQRMFHMLTGCTVAEYVRKRKLTLAAQELAAKKAKVLDSDRVPVGDEFVKRTIPASTWAVFTSVGPMPKAIQEVTQKIYQEWFPATGYEHAGTAELEVYPPGNLDAEDYRCEVWIPIVKK